MEINGSFTSSHFTCSEGTPVRIKQEAGRAAEQVWTFWKTEKPLAPQGNRNTKQRAEGKEEENEERGNERSKERWRWLERDMPVPDDSGAARNLLVVYPCPAKDFYLDRSHCSIKIWQLAGAQGAWAWELAARKRRSNFIGLPNARETKSPVEGKRNIEKMCETELEDRHRKLWEMQPCIKCVTLQVTKSVLLTSHFTVIWLW